MVGLCESLLFPWASGSHRRSSHGEEAEMNDSSLTEEIYNRRDVSRLVRLWTLKRNGLDELVSARSHFLSIAMIQQSNQVKAREKGTCVNSRSVVLVAWSGLWVGKEIDHERCPDWLLVEEIMQSKVCFVSSPNLKWTALRDPWISPFHCY